MKFEKSRQMTHRQAVRMNKLGIPFEAGENRMTQHEATRLINEKLCALGLGGKRRHGRAPWRPVPTTEAG